MGFNTFRSQPLNRLYKEWKEIKKLQNHQLPLLTAPSLTAILAKNIDKKQQDW
jgi:hypothetical protein